MTFPRFVLLATGLVFGGFGLAFFVSLDAILALVDVTVPTPIARTELRAAYGGLELGIGVGLVAAFRNKAWLVPGLFFGALSLGGLGAARLLGMVVDATHSASAHWALLLPEAFGTALLVIAYRQARTTTVASTDES